MSRYESPFTWLIFEYLFQRVLGTQEKCFRIWERERSEGMLRALQSDWRIALGFVPPKALFLAVVFVVCLEAVTPLVPSSVSWFWPMCYWGCKWSYCFCDSEWLLPFMSHSIDSAVKERVWKVILETWIWYQAPEFGFFFLQSLTSQSLETLIQNPPIFTVSILCLPLSWWLTIQPWDDAG